MSEEWKPMADWSDLPDVYVTKVECQQGMFWRVEACSVPMVTLPECRLIRADVVAAETKAHEKEIAVWSENYAALERQLAEAREALRFYADKSGWNQPPVQTREGLLSVEYENQASKIQKDRGAIARAALTPKAPS